MPFVQTEKSISIFFISAKNVFEAKMECKLRAKKFPKPVKVPEAGEILDIQILIHTNFRSNRRCYLIGLLCDQLDGDSHFFIKKLGGFFIKKGFGVINPESSARRLTISTFMGLEATTRCSISPGFLPRCVPDVSIYPGNTGENSNQLGQLVG